VRRERDSIALQLVSWHMPPSFDSTTRPLTPDDFVARDIERHHGRWTLDGCALSELADRFGTPLYVYSARILQRSWQQLRDTFPPEFGIYYSMKANPHQAFLQFFLKRGCGLEIASGGELQQGLAAGCNPRHMIYAGPGKTDVELQLAVEHGLGEIHVESPGEIARLARLARAREVKAPVALRVNPNLQTAGASLQMGGRASPFGIDEDQLPEFVATAVAEPSITLIGLHLNTGTQILHAAKLLEYYRHGIEIARRVARQLKAPLQTLDLGGGLGIPYFSGQAPLDLAVLRSGLLPLVDEIRSDPWLSWAQLMIEPGRFLVGEAGMYLMRVLDVKMSRGQRFIVADGGMHHHAAATGNFGQTLKRPFPIAVVDRAVEPGAEAVTLVGPLCTPLDIFGRNLPLGNVQVGDLVVVFQSGAYARSASPLSFLGHPSPAEVWLDQRGPHLIRTRGTWRDELRDQRPVSADVDRD
jgi:diaminopimelate decarboxylase